MIRVEKCIYFIDGNPLTIISTLEIKLLISIRIGLSVHRTQCSVFQYYFATTYKNVPYDNNSKRNMGRVAFQQDLWNTSCGIGTGLSAEDARNEKSAFQRRPCSVQRWEWKHAREGSTARVCAGHRMPPRGDAFEPNLPV